LDGDKFCVALLLSESKSPEDNEADRVGTLNGPPCALLYADNKAAQEELPMARVLKTFADGLRAPPGKTLLARGWGIEVLLPGRQELKNPPAVLLSFLIGDEEYGEFRDVD
jgi:hypothetical protein